MRLTMFSLLLSLCISSLPAQEPISKVAPPWGVGILMGKETETATRSMEATTVDNIFGGRTNDAFCTSLVVRKRF
jgi:hypothetical protein